MLLNTAVKRQRQVAESEFKASLIYKASSSTARATLKNPVLKNKKQKKEGRRENRNPIYKLYNQHNLLFLINLQIKFHTLKLTSSKATMLECPFGSCELHIRFYPYSMEYISIHFICQENRKSMTEFGLEKQFCAIILFHCCVHCLCSVPPLLKCSPFWLSPLFSLIFLFFA